MSAEAARPSRGPIVALVIAVGAVLSSWNPFAAPIGLILGIAVAWAALRMLVSKRGSRQLAVWALALGGIALAISAVVLLLSAGALSATPGQATMSDRTPDEVNRMLDDAQQRTAAARKRAGGELDQVLPIKPGGSSARDSAEGKRRDQQKSTTVAE